MKKYLTIYATLARVNFSMLTMYRSNFVNSMASSIAWSGFSVLFIIILTMRTTHAFGWQREEIILLTGAYSVLIGVFHTLFSRNFERLSRVVSLGQLDYLLVKPADSQFLLSVWLINYTSLIRILVGVAIIVYLLPNLHVSVTVATLVWSAFLLAIGLMLLYSIWYIVATLTIWFTRISNIVDLMYSVSGIARFPRAMMAQLHAFVFLFLLPFTFIINVPVKTLLQKGTWVEAGTLTSMALLFFIASRKFWFFALRHYTSASS